MNKLTPSIAAVLVICGTLQGSIHAAPVDVLLTDTAQINIDPFPVLGATYVGVNFFYSNNIFVDALGEVSGAFHGAGFDNINLSGDLSQPFILSANASTNQTTFSFSTSNSISIHDRARQQLTSALGVDAATVNALSHHLFYVSSDDNDYAAMTFGNLKPLTDVYVQVLGGGADGGWAGDFAVTANGTPVPELWATVTDGAGSAASLFGFYAQTDANGELNLQFNIAAGNHAGISGILIAQQAPEPSAWILGACSLLGLAGVAYKRRRTQRRAD